MAGIKMVDHSRHSRRGVKDVIGKVAGSRGKRYALQGELIAQLWIFISQQTNTKEGKYMLYKVSLDSSELVSVSEVV